VTLDFEARSRSGQSGLLPIPSCGAGGTFPTKTATDAGVRVFGSRGKKKKKKKVVFGRWVLSGQ
jgi:hypothetical protein